MTDTSDSSDSAAPKKKRFKSEVLVAVAAIVISIMTLFVYIYQARIMMDQQHTTVWPYVEWTPTLLYTDEEQEFYIEVINKGVGPAVMKDTRLTLNGKEFIAPREMLGQLLGDSIRNRLWIFYSEVDNRVLAPGEHVKIFHVKNWKNTRVPYLEFSRLGLAFSICYCNIYGDCWTTEGTVSRESDCD